MVSLFILLVISPFPAQAQKITVLKMASAAIAEYAEVEKRFVDSFNAKCGPGFKIEFYPAQQMVPFPELLDAVRTGTADMGVITPNAHSAYDPRLAVVELPFLFNNIDAHMYAVPKIEPIYAKILEEKFNQKLLCLHNYSAVELFSTKPVRRLEDWKGLLVQSISPVTSAVVKALGGSSVAIPYTEAYQALSKKTVDAVITAPAAGRVFALPEVAPHMTLSYMVAAVHGFTINVKVWNRLPAKIQQLLLEEAKAHSKYYDDWVKKEYFADLDRLSKAGVQIYAIPDSEISRWKGAVRAYVEEQLKTLGDVGKSVMEIAAEANAKYPRK